MRGDLLQSHRHLPAEPAAAPSALARKAVALGAGGGAAVATALGTFGVAYAVGGEDATADNWVGSLVVVGFYGGLITAFAAFALAVLARTANDRWSWLWLPLALFPAAVGFLVLGELLWWE